MRPDPNNVHIKSSDQKNADIWRNRFIKAAGLIANHGGAEVASRHLIEREENALNKLLYWEERLNRGVPGRSFDLGAEMAKYEPSRPGGAPL